MEPNPAYKVDFESQADCVAVLAADGSLLEVNPAGLRMIEAESFRQAAKKSFHALVIADHRDAFRRLTARVFRGETGTLDFQIVGLRGGQRWLATSASPLRDARGAITALLGIARDVTERKHREAELRESEALLREAQELACIGWFTHDLVSGRMTASDQMHAIFGRGPREELTFEWFLDALHPDDRERAREQLMAVFRSSETALRIEYRVLPPGRSPRHLLALGRITRDPTGNPLRLFGTAQDVTEAKRAQEALSASEERLRLALDAAHMGEWEWNMITGEVTWSRQCLALYGLPPDTSMSYERFLQALHPGDREDVDLALRRAVENRTTYDEEKRTIWPDRSVHWTASRGHVLYDAVGQPVRMLGVTFDITERKEAEEEQARLARAAEQAAESIVITDPHGAIVYVNPAFERLTGYSRQEAVGQNPRILKSGQHDQTFYRGMWEALARGEVWTGRVVNRRKDGTRFEEDATIAPVFDLSGQLVNYVGVKRDVTKEVQLERRLLLAEKLEAVGRLAGGIAHDFNSLLMVITSYAHLALLRLAGHDPARPKIEQILEAANRAASLTRQLLAFGRNQPLQPKVLDLNAAVTDAERLLQRLVREDIEHATSLGPEIGSIKADPGQIDQILLNLVANAADAMPRGGRVKIETANVELDAAYAASHPPAQPGRYVMLAVSDTGEGMDAETQSHIFEPFFTTKEVGKGSGLGLATVYGIVKQSGGHIRVDSEVGLGTTFKVYLPRVEEEAQPAKQEEREAVPRRRGTETILLVEDEPMVRDALREILDAEGYHVLVARNGAEALQAANEYQGTIHLLVSDIVVPGLSGAEASLQLRPARPQLKVLSMSGYLDGTLAQWGMPGAGEGSLSKPFSSEAFLREVRTLLDRR
jgi:PAS domain S-box-containing protein